MDVIPQILEKLIWQADNLAKLGAIGAWVFISLYLILERVWTQRTQKAAAEHAWEARVEEAKADVMMAGAVEKLADQIRELRYEIKGRGSNGAN